MQAFKINFDKQQNFELRNIKPLMGICGLYFIFLKETEISYPFGKSRLIYIGMSEKRLIERCRVSGLFPPLGSLFEISTLIFFEACVLELMNCLGIEEEVMRKIHVNL